VFTAGYLFLISKFLKQVSELTTVCSALNMFLVVNEPEEQEFSLKKSKFQQILGNMFRAEI
jgi:hypothetical protein